MTDQAVSPGPRRFVPSRALRLSAAFAAFGLVPLAALAFVAVRTGGDAVSQKVKDSLRLSTQLSALYLEAELAGLADVNASFARRPTLVRALERQLATPADRASVRLALRQLINVRPGVGTAFLADSKGVLIDILPATPSIVGKSFGYRDWYQGVTRTGRTYVSRAYRSQVKGRPAVVAIATPVVSGGRGRRRLGILVVAYRLDQLASFARRIGHAEDVLLEVTDQYGVAIAVDRRLEEPPLSSHRDEPFVAAALAGRSGVVQIRDAGEETVAAYAPVPKLGWTVVAETPAHKAYASVAGLRSKVLLIALLLMLVLVAGALLLARVLRQRYAAEQEMAVALDSAQRLATVNRAVLEAMEEGLALIGLDGRIISLNRRLHEMLEELLPGEAEVGRPLADVQQRVAARVTDPDGYMATVASAADDPEYRGTDVFTYADTGRMFVRTIAPVRDGRGELIGRILTIREVTAEREAERLKSELVATVSHELRTPLASIMGFAELLTEREYEEETQQRFLGTIRSEAARLTTLVNDFLDLQRIESGGFTLALEPFELGDLVREKVEFYSAQSAEHELVFELPDEPVGALGERDRVGQVLGNLLSNAIKYSPAGGRIDVRLAQRGAAARVEVADAGLGIPAEQQPKLFSRFFRVDSSDVREIGGTGLGLALCKEIVEAHGGWIGFESVEGYGSTFWFELPTKTRGGAEGRPVVLVVEDDPAAAALLARYLTDADYAVDVLATGEDALARAGQGDVVAICLDITLAGELDGWEVLSRLKANPATSAIPVLICTGGNGRGRSAALGASDFLAKPFTGADLRAALERAVPGGLGSVLVVDDEEAVRSLVLETIGRNGIRVREAEDGEDALAQVAARRPDAIVLDLLMPKLDGFEVLERLQADPATREIPVIVLTARRLSSGERLLLTRRAVSLLDKNEYSGDELRGLVERALGQELVSK